MSLIYAKMQKRINGHKGLTDHKNVIDVNDVNPVYIPLASGNSTSFDIKVEVGDKVKVGTLLAVRNDGLIVPLFSSVSGTIQAIQKHKHGLGEIDHVVIENDFNFEKADLETIDYEAATREELVEFTKNKGIVGCGGAGFPTYVKYGNPEGIEKVIINAVECEPFITADYKEIDDNVRYLMTGVLAMQKMADAKEVVIAIKTGKKVITEKMRNALPNSSVSVVEVPDAYPMGWERTLIRHLEKKEYENIPSEIGLIVNNSTTAISLGQAMENGMPIVNKFVTVSGDALKDPVNVNVLVGTPVSKLLEITKLNRDEVVLINGGPMMGNSMDNDEFVITPYSNAITVMAEVKTEAIPCLRCGSCSDHCPAGLQPVRIMEAFQRKDWDAVRELRADKCIECGLCSYVCPSKIEVSNQVILAKKVIAKLKK